MEMMLDKKQIRVISLLKFKMGWKDQRQLTTWVTHLAQELLMDVQCSGGSRSSAKECLEDEKCNGQPLDPITPSWHQGISCVISISLLPQIWPTGFMFFLHQVQTSDVLVLLSGDLASWKISGLFTRAMLCAGLTCFSHVHLFATPQTIVHQVPLSMGFSR